MAFSQDSNSGAQVTIDELLRRNKQAAKTYKPHPLLREIPKDAPMPKIFIVSCCDFRVEPIEILGLQKTDAVIARSAAGRMMPQLQNLLFLDQVLNFTEVMIIHHTDCSASMLKNDDVRQVLKSRAPGRNNEIDSITFPGFDGSSVEQTVRDDVELVKNSGLVRKELADKTRGFVFNIETGILNAVE